MLAKAKRKDNGKWITGYPFTCDFSHELDGNYKKL